MYADFPLAAQSDFADFHVSLDRPANLRRWYKPQVFFRFDGSTPFRPLPLDQAFAFFEWGLNWCVASQAHRYLIIHAAVVEKDGFAAILPAPPGSGKSTLCAALVTRGWRLLSDELALIRLVDGKLLPLPRPVSLKNASIQIMRDYAPDGIFAREVRGTVKGTVCLMKPPRDSVVRAGELAHAAWIIFPKYQADTGPQLVALPKSRTFMRVAENSFNYSLLGSRAFETLGKVIDGSQCFDFTYSALDDAMEVFSSLKPMALAA
ncbi:MAG: HprK-related kinase [Herminiimonas sp.]|nr:HprK-related kinase [Herminiimonas sp.]